MKHTITTRITVMTALAGLLVIPLCTVSTASATTMSVSREIYVTARVLPMRHIIIDHTGQILEITSNTSDELTPEVYLLAVKPENKRQMSTEIENLYHRYVPDGTARAGVLYRRDISKTATATTSAFKPTWHR